MSLKVIGLISGGKDSLFSLAHCVKNGHTIVALANLFPPTEASDNVSVEGRDIDSFMYQTVGHTVLPLYADALEVPVYRREISGEAIQTSKDYDTYESIPRDETEDMYLLIQEVLKHHPEANALNAGAILSTYQRTRVESVAVRLCLTPLAYLWQYPLLPSPVVRSDSLTGLLDDMALAGCDSRIIKLASAGIRVNLLSQNVTNATVRQRLISGLSQFFGPDEESTLRGAVLGEGGEYETLALDGPHPLWKRRIEIDFHDPFEGEGGTSYATFNNARVSEKMARDVDSPTPTVYDAKFAKITKDCLERCQDSSSGHKRRGGTQDVCLSFQTTIQRTTTTLQLSNVAAGSPELSPTRQLELVFDQIVSILSRLSEEGYDVSLRNAISATLILRSIETFTDLNPVYATRLWPKGLPLPPSRVTIAAPLPENVDVSLSIMFEMKGEIANRRNGLHVQSLSYWAPANIGPYSQAISAKLHSPSYSNSTTQSQGETPRSGIDVVHMAGQIPLIPATMQISEDSFHKQVALALQHLWRVGQERRVDVWTGAGVAYLSCVNDNFQLLRERACIAAQVWMLANSLDEQGSFHCANPEGIVDDSSLDISESEDVDVWDLQQRTHGLGISKTNHTIGNHLHRLPNPEIISFSPEIRNNNLSQSLASPTHVQWAWTPSFIAAHITGLPRDAPIEWFSTGIAGLLTAAKSKQCTVNNIHHEISSGVKISGLAIDHIASNLGQESDSADVGHPQIIQSSAEPAAGLSIFLALLVGQNAEISAETIEKLRLQNLAVSLFNDIQCLSATLVTAQAFVSLSVSEEIAIAIRDLEVVQQACIVNSYRIFGADPQATGSTSSHEVNVQELAAAVVFRLDVIYG